ncbi:hypothetical protein AB0C29_03945 [Actinoplanes sp. NPDC048791]|uniref:hypothetical protein n=1 Tax=Actinoplanes sp. NPDC048791 TaxID=3154623 RepID=UPI003407BC3B
MATRPNNLAIRLALPLAMIGLTAVGAATPARAEAAAEQPTIEISAPERVVTTSGATKTVPFEVVNAGETAATGLTLDFALTGTAIDPRLGFKPGPGCTATGCTIGDLAPGARKAFSLTVTPTAALPTTGAAIGLVVHDAGGAWKESTTVTVVREAAGVDLETARIPDIELAAGKSAVLPISVRNNGDKAAEGVALALAGPRYISYPNNYSNCVKVKDLPGVVCVFDLTLAPGSTFGMSPTTPLTVAADVAAPGPASYTAGVAALGLDDDEAGLAAATKAARKPGAKLQLVPAARSLAAGQRELNEWDNATSFQVKVPLNPADSLAIGDNFEGKIGDTRTVKVGFRNDGPATVLGRTTSWIHAAKVRIPSGLALTKVDKHCVPNGDGDPSWDQPGQVSGHDYLCVASKPLAKGEQQLFSFTAKIEDGENEDEGSITVDGGVQDQKTTNNVAKIEVKLTTGGSGSGSGGSGGGSGGGLPITGAPAGRIAGAGMLLVLTGAMALVLTRRRRPV